MPTHVGQIGRVRRRRRIGDLGDRQEVGAVEVLDHSEEILGEAHLDPRRERGLSAVRRRHDRLGEPAVPRRAQLREHSAHRAHLAGQRELPQHQRRRELVRLHSLEAGEECDCDRQVERGAGLAEITWREIEHEVLLGHRVAARLERGPHAHAALADSAFGKPDQLDVRQPRAHSRFDLNGMGVDAQDTACVHHVVHGHAPLHGSCRSPRRVISRG